MDIQYINEHLRPGQLGHFFAICAFVFALFSSFSYWSAARAENKNPDSVLGWIKLGRNGFVLHVAATLGIFFTLYYIITNHLFEYHYAWEHSSYSLQSKYLLSCFWEGQQGSFLLWSTWHSVLGLIVMRNAKSLESRTMTIIALVQAFLATMILGFYITDDIKIGTTAFGLLRDAMEAPIFARPDYLSLIEDGNGLNVLLQNYWMVIHPPVLFLGFSATLIPFAYIVAALWKGDYKTFVKPTINWSLFAGGVLGLGIMMGGAWAYESLTFGGYWAWDPVENASLVPWLVLVAGLHTLVIYKATGRSLMTTAIFLVLAYILIWYSTFLTRTGILGDTSVHAFTGEGSSLKWHLLIVIFVVAIIGFGVIFYRRKKMPSIKTEETTATREFWMFIGSVVLLLSALQIIILTSLPVWAPLAKAITGDEIAPPVDVVSQYNRIQVWVAIVIGIFTASILFLKFKKSDNKKFWKRMCLTGGIALVLAIVIGINQKINEIPYALLLFAGSFGVVANIYYIIKVQKFKFKKAGPVAHLGFAMMLVGILLSSFGKEVISINSLGKVFNFGKDMSENIRESRENILLYKDVPVAMSEFNVTYRGDSTSESDPRTFYKVNYENIKTNERFTLYPDAFINPKGQQGLTANPDSRHYLTRDIFTYITSAIDKSKLLDTANFTAHTLKPGDSAFLNNGYLVFNEFDQNPVHKNYVSQSGDLAIGANISVYSLDTLAGNIHPVFVLRGQQVVPVYDTFEPLKLVSELTKILPESGAIELSTMQKDAGEDYIVMKAIVFPYINVLWLGIVVMVMGFILSLINRLTKKEKSEPERKA